MRETLRRRRYDDGIFEERKNSSLRVPTKQLYPDRNSRTSSFEEGETDAGREARYTAGRKKDLACRQPYFGLSTGFSRELRIYSPVEEPFTYQQPYCVSGVLICLRFCFGSKTDPDLISLSLFWSVNSDLLDRLGLF